MANGRNPSSSVQGVAIIIFLGAVLDVGMGTLLLLQAGAPEVSSDPGLVRGIGLSSVLVGALCGAAAVGFWRLHRWAWTTVATLLWIDICFRGLALLASGITLLDAVVFCFFVGLLLLVYRVHGSFASDAAGGPLRCPHCDREYPADARFCPQCGGDLPRCPRCGRAHALLAPECPWCREPLRPPQPGSGRGGAGSTDDRSTTGGPDGRPGTH